MQVLLSGLRFVNPGAAFPHRHPPFALHRSLGVLGTDQTQRKLDYIVLGASGLIGRTLVASLLQNSHRVFAIVRESQLIPLSERGIRVLIPDDNRKIKIQTFYPDDKNFIVLSNLTKQEAETYKISRQQTVVFSALKTFQIKDSIAQLAGVFPGEKTNIVCLQNGLGAVRIAAAATLLMRTGVEILAASVNSASRLHDSKAGQAIAVYPGKIYVEEARDNPELVAQLRQATSKDTSIYDLVVTSEIQRIKYLKTAANAALNALTVLSGKTLHGVISDPCFPPIISKICSEIHKIATMEGIDVKLNELEGAVYDTVARAFPEHRSSTYNDLARLPAYNPDNPREACPNPTEIPAINGEMERLGQMYRLDVSMNAFIVKMIEELALTGAEKMVGIHDLYQLRPKRLRELTYRALILAGDEVAINAAFRVLTILTGKTLGEIYADDNLRQLIEVICKEVQIVMRATSRGLKLNIFSNPFVAISNAVKFSPDSCSPVLESFDKGRTNEIHSINRVIVEMGEKYKVQVEEEYRLQKIQKDDNITPLNAKLAEIMDKLAQKRTGSTDCKRFLEQELSNLMQQLHKTDLEAPSEGPAGRDFYGTMTTSEGNFVLQGNNPGNICLIPDDPFDPNSWQAKLRKGVTTILSLFNP